MERTTVRSPWVVVPVTVAADLVLYVWLAWGAEVVSSVAWFVLFVLGLTGPIFAVAYFWRTPSPPMARGPADSLARAWARHPVPITPHSSQVQLAEEGRDSRPFRRSLLAFLAFPLVAAVLMGWLGRGGMLVGMSVALVFFGIMFLTPVALLVTAAARGGREEFEPAARSLWTLVLAGAVYGLALPIGAVFESIAFSKAHAWVETAAAEVRSIERATGSLPPDLQEVVARIGPAPRPAYGPDGGYRPLGEPGAFQFLIGDKAGLFGSLWIYEGKSGAWKHEVD